MKKSTGRARAKAPRRSSDDATAVSHSRKQTTRPDPEDFEVFIPDAVPVDAATDDDVFVPEVPVFRPPEPSGIGQSYYPVHATDADPHKRGLTWDCPHGCPGRIYGFGDDLQVHTWDCPWWTREGKDQTPFELIAHGGGAADREKPPAQLADALRTGYVPGIRKRVG